MVFRTKRHESKEGTGKTRPLTIILLLSFMATWTFLSEIEDFFRNVIFSS